MIESARTLHNNAGDDAPKPAERMRELPEQTPPA